MNGRENSETISQDPDFLREPCFFDEKKNTPGAPWVACESCVEEDASETIARETAETVVLMLLVMLLQFLHVIFLPQMQRGSCHCCCLAWPLSALCFPQCNNQVANVLSGCALVIVVTAALGVPVLLLFFCRRS